MSYVITQECIGCQLCRIECPTNAIQRIEGGLKIDASLCNDCVGYYGTPQCASICPTNQGCVPAPFGRGNRQQAIGNGFVYCSNTDSSDNHYWEDWFARYNTLLRRLKSQKQGIYWQKWFDTYSERLTLLFSEQ